MKELTRSSTTPARLREALKEAGKKQIDLAEETGLSHSTISRYFSGQMEPKQKAVMLIAKALGVSEMWLWGYDVPKARTPEHAKNDQLSQLIVRMRRDPAFYTIVEMLDRVPAEQLENLGGLIAGLIKE